MYLKNIPRGTQFCLVAIASAAQQSLASEQGADERTPGNGLRFDGLSLLGFLVR
jgi:hypothetical protein